MASPGPESIGLSTITGIFFPPITVVVFIFGEESAVPNMDIAVVWDDVSREGVASEEDWESDTESFRW